MRLRSEHRIGIEPSGIGDGVIEREHGFVGRRLDKLRNADRAIAIGLVRRIFPLVFLTCGQILNLQESGKGTTGRLCGWIEIEYDSLLLKRRCFHKRPISFKQIGLSRLMNPFVEFRTMFVWELDYEASRFQPPSDK